MENTAIRFEIPVHRMPEFNHKIDALNKKALKVGAEPIKVSVFEDFTREYKRHPVTDELLLFPMVIKFNRVQVEGASPKFNGWSFIARIDHLPSGDNVVNAIPGVEIDIRYRTLGNVCEHCNINRFRKSSFVVRHEHGEEKQVGSACLKDFLGHGSPEAVASFCEGIFALVREVRERDFLNGGDRMFSVESVLNLTMGVVRAYGWLSATNARENGGVSTAQTVRDCLFDDKRYKQVEKDMGEITPEEKIFAGQALAWIRAYQGEMSDYIYNLHTVCKGSAVDVKHISLVCSLIAVYKREVEKNLVQAVKIPSQWIGQVKERVTIKNARVTYYSPIETHYGTCHVYHFLAGNDRLTYFASKNMSVNENEVVNIVATIKKLDEYKGQKQTVITRAKINRPA